MLVSTDNEIFKSDVGCEVSFVKQKNKKQSPRELVTNYMILRERMLLGLLNYWL